jgi:hypothetical protein
VSRAAPSRSALVVVAAFLAALVLPSGGAVTLAQPEDDRVLARAFEVRYRPLSDVAHLIEPILSDDGAITLRPRLKTLVVEDRVSVLDKVSAILASYDLPPRNVEVTFSLFLGTDRREEEGGPTAVGPRLSSEVRGVLETLKDVTKWTDYDGLGSRSVTGAEGDTVVAILSDEYRVVFAVENVHEVQGVIKLQQQSLQRLSRDEDGATAIHELYSASLGVGIGKLTVVGAARDAGSRRALFLTLQARPKAR